jgi:hypothetical protein
MLSIISTQPAKNSPKLLSLRSRPRLGSRLASLSSGPVLLSSLSSLSSKSTYSQRLTFGTTPTSSRGLHLTHISPLMPKPNHTVGHGRTSQAEPSYRHRNRPYHRQRPYDHDRDRGREADEDHHDNRAQGYEREYPTRYEPQYQPRDDYRPTHGGYYNNVSRPAPYSYQNSYPMDPARNDDPNHGHGYDYEHTSAPAPNLNTAISEQAYGGPSDRNTNSYSGGAGRDTRSTRGGGGGGAGQRRPSPNYGQWRNSSSSRNQPSDGIRAYGNYPPNPNSSSSSSRYEQPRTAYVNPPVPGLTRSPSPPSRAVPSSSAPSVPTEPAPSEPTPEYLASSLLPSHPLTDPTSLRKLLILDLNGSLLIRAGHRPPPLSSRTARLAPGETRVRPVHPRAYMPPFTAYLFHPSTRAWLDVMVWSSAQPHSVRSMVDACFGDKKDALVAMWARDTLGLTEADYGRHLST